MPLPTASTPPTASIPRLITLPISPFNELARWSLERRRIPYREEPQALVWHGGGGGGPTTPVLVTDTEALGDSREICSWADRQPAPGPRIFPDGHQGDEVRSFVDRMVEELGPQTRRIAWGHLIEDVSLADRYWGQALDGRQRRWQLRLLKIGRPIVRRRLRLGPEQLEDAAPKVRAIFDLVAEMIGDGERYLFGDSMSAADMAFAAMSMPAVLPKEGFPVDLPDPDAMGKMGPGIDELREHPAGRFALRLYREERRPKASDQSAAP